MLPPNYLENVEKQAIQIYNNLELKIIEEIAERISNVGYANTIVKNDVLIAQEMGMLYADIVDLVSKYNKTSYEEISKIFEDAGITTIKNDDEIYKMAGLNPIKLKQDKAMMDLLIASVNKTNSNLSNLVMTTANTSQLEFINAMNKAYMEVSTGVKSYSQSIIDVVNDMCDKGTKVVYPSGHTISIESAARMNIVTGVNQTCGKMQLLRAEELDWDLMEITAHIGARPEHADWQGKIVSRSGKKGYLSLQDIGYGEVTGFKGINCRHDWNPYYEGSTKTYTEEELKEMQNEKVNYNGQEITRYDATQIQRKLEREIRQDKKQISGLQGLLKGNNEELSEKEINSRLNYYSARLYKNNWNLKELIKQTELTEQNYRTKVADKGNYSTKKVVNYAKKLYNKDGNIDNINSFIKDERIRKNIRNKYNLNIQSGKQDKHIKGTNNYKEGRSYLTISSENIQEIINNYAGTGRIIRSTNGVFQHKEKIMTENIIGMNVNPKTNEEIETKNAIIHYGKEGVHIVPSE